MGRVIPFSQFDFSGHHGWLSICDGELKDWLEEAERRFSFAISTDFDLGYAVLADSGMKDVVMPDSKVSEYKGYHFPKS